MRVLTWNLFHGRSRPPAPGLAPGRALAGAFAALIRSWDWDIAMLQETPPWWPGRLAREASAEQRTALTSRNALLPLRRALAERWPELMRSNGGGANAVLVRATPIRAYREVTLRRRPERRVAQLVRLQDGTTIANFHGSTRAALAEDELSALWRIGLEWAGGSPLLLGGDLNLRSPAAGGGGVAHLASRDVDHIFGRGVESSAPARVLERRTSIAGREVALSDHPPLLAEVTRSVAGERTRPIAAS
jgi:endonuclease/exonuclease/phosphatase family metal-dependent hydrolase